MLPVAMDWFVWRSAAAAWGRSTWLTFADMQLQILGMSGLLPLFIMQASMNSSARAVIAVSSTVMDSRVANDALDLSYCMTYPPQRVFKLR